jgi:hypothetical protein
MKCIIVPPSQRAHHLISVIPPMISPAPITHHLATVIGPIIPPPPSAHHLATVLSPIIPPPPMLHHLATVIGARFISPCAPTLPVGSPMPVWQAHWSLFNSKNQQIAFSIGHTGRLTCVVSIVTIYHTISRALHCAVTSQNRGVCG